MNTELIVIMTLCVVVFCQQWFYLKQIQKLVDKIMAGNYSNYAQGQAHVNDSLRPQEFRVPMPQQEEFDELSQLNSMIRPPLP